MLHGDLVIEGEWDFMLGEGVKGLLYWWQAGARGSILREKEKRVKAHLTNVEMVKID